MKIVVIIFEKTSAGRKTGSKELSLTKKALYIKRCFQMTRVFALVRKKKETELKTTNNKQALNPHYYQARQALLPGCCADGD